MKSIEQLKTIAQITTLVVNKSDIRQRKKTKTNHRQSAVRPNTLLE